MSVLKYIQAAEHFGDAKLFVFWEKKTTIIHVFNYKYTAVETHVRSPYLYKPFLSLSLIYRFQYLHTYSHCISFISREICYLTSLILPLKRNIKLASRLMEQQQAGFANFSFLALGRVLVSLATKSLR